MRSLSDLISDSKKPEPNGGVVIASFLVFVAVVLAVPAAMVWAASNMSAGF
jgi:hypothetical protein